MNIMNKFTLRTLKMNKIRTLITIIGIILSVSMLTAVTTFISSIQQFAINYAVSKDGDWHGVVFHLNDTERERVASDKEVAEFGIGQYIGYAFIDSVNEYKPYVYVQGLGEAFADLLPIHLTSGKMPATKDEIILPNHLNYNGGVEYKLEDRITLELGDRYLEGELLYQENPYISNEDSLDEENLAEEFKVRETRSYQVVGFYERPAFENFSAAGYTALTLEDKGMSTVYDTYIKLEKPKNIYSYIEDNFSEKAASFNNSYLRYMNVSNNSNYNKTLYGLGSILILIIMFGSVSLIYNAFSISVSERMKQFGLISSIGGTKRQIIKSVLFEAIVLCGIGIPLGIISGIVGIGVTLKVTEALFIDLFDVDIPMTLFVSWISVLVAGVVGFITVLISAYIPAKRAGRVSAIEAIRQTKDIQIKNRAMKISPLVYKLFGLEGMIASKNFKRNRKKYKATILSLFMSVVLFISASSFCTYLAQASGVAIKDLDYDIYYSFNPRDASGVGHEQAIQIMESVEGVTKLSYYMDVRTFLQVNKADLTKKYIDFVSKESILEEDDEGRVKIETALVFMDDTTFFDYRKEKGYSSVKEDGVFTPIVMNAVSYYLQEEGRYHAYEIFNKKNVNLYFQSEQEIEETDFLTAGVETKAPFGMEDNSYGPLVVILPLSQRETAFEFFEIDQHEAEYPFSIYLKTKNHKEDYKKIYKAIEEEGLAPYRLYNARENASSNQAMITIIRIFSYGFITLISLIAVANVFNTITTNIALRRVEFAMLKSTGMTKKGFRKMMNFECLLYGIRSLFFGIPVSIVITYFIYHSVGYGVEMKFSLPWESIMIAVGSVFLVVFATMLYSMHKISKENTVDALKNENL